MSSISQCGECDVLNCVLWKYTGRTEKRCTLETTWNCGCWVKSVLIDDGTLLQPCTDCIKNFESYTLCDKCSTTWNDLSNQKLVARKNVVCVYFVPTVAEP